MANANGKAAGSETLIRLDEIQRDPKWNVRSNLEESQRSADEAATFDDFVKNIFNNGQDTAVTLRPQEGKKPYFLVTGNRRIAALLKIAEKGIDPKWAPAGWCKNPTVRAEIRRMNDIEAFELNIRENTEREDLSPPDLCFGIGRLLAAYRKANNKYTQQTVADMVGYSQAYVGKLMNIVDRCRPEVFEAWRNAPLKLTVDEMNKVANLPPADQEKAYQELLRPVEGGGKGQGDPIKAAGKAAANAGKMLGTLVREGALDVDLDSEWWLSNIELMVKIKNRVGKNGGTKKPTEGQIAKVAKAAEKSYADTLTEQEVSEEDGETPKKGRKPSREVHADN